MSKVVMILSVLSLVLELSSCTKLEPKAPAKQDAMNAPLEGLTAEQNLFFNQGAEEFDEVYTSATGLGPMFVSTSCASCHSDDNRGHLFTVLTRFGQSDSSGNHFMHLGGPQLQHRSLPDFTPESLPSEASHANFIAPIVAGLGFLELVPESDLLAMADPNDLDGDGISGRVSWNYIPQWVTSHSNAISNNGRYLCRFGRKASSYNIFQQTVQAFNQDMGITTSFLPVDPQHPNSILPPVPSDVPEVRNNDLMGTVFYIQTLQKPEPRNQQDANVLAGKQIFLNAGCEKCHRESLKTGYSPVAPLSNQEFHPYTDLLLHDMGPLLDDGYTEGFAGTAEWRTTPLWGLGLAKDAQGGKLYLMHDGRARSIADAILLHGGESQSSKEFFLNLSETQRNQLITFLNSL
jgi:CxxC motif-containing protein (DUF1111 family)